MGYINPNSSFLLLISGELDGKFVDPTRSTDSELRIATAPLFIHTSSKARWSVAGCALQLDPERSKYVYNLEGTMRSNRFTQIRSVQDWQSDVDVKEESTVSESDNVEYEAGKKMIHLATDIEMQSPQKHI